MLEEEGAVIVGLLVGLNVIDANLCVKGEDLDSQVSFSDKPHLYRTLNNMPSNKANIYSCSFAQKRVKMKNIYFVFLQYSNANNFNVVQLFLCLFLSTLQSKLPM